MKAGAWSIKGSLVNNGRCPKCTLKPPCKHYERSDDLPSLQQVQPAKKKLGHVLQQLPPIPPPSKHNQAFIPPVSSSTKKTEDAYQKLLNAESDPITAGLVQSYLRRQQHTQNSPSVQITPSLQHAVNLSSTPLTTDGHNHTLQKNGH